MCVAYFEERKEENGGVGFADMCSKGGGRGWLFVRAMVTRLVNALLRLRLSRSCTITVAGTKSVLNDLLAPYRSCLSCLAQAAVPRQQGL